MFLNEKNKWKKILLQYIKRIVKRVVLSSIPEINYINRIHGRGNEYNLKSADNFSSVWFSPCLWRFCLILGLEALDMTCMQTPSPYPVRSRGFDLSINEEC